MTDVGSLFADLDTPPAAFRGPGAGEHGCSVCGVACGFGMGWPPKPLTWFCRAHLPPGFLPTDR